MIETEKSYKQLRWYLAVVLAIVLPLFFKSGYLFLTDFYFGPNMPINFFSNSFVTVFLIKLFSLFYFYDVGQKIFISVALLIILLGGKKLSENFVNNKWLIFLSSLFFLFNPFVYDRIMYGQVGIVIALGFLCWALGYLLEYFKKKQQKQIYLTGILAGFMIQFSPHFIFFFILAYFIFIVILLLNKERAGKVLKNSLIIFALIIVLNTNYLAGLFMESSNTLNFINQGIQKQDLVIFQTSGKTGIGALGNVVMMSGFWGKDRFRYVDLTQQKENWGRSFLFLLPLIIWGVVSSFKREAYRFLTLGLLILFVIAAILAVGIRLPISSDITYWLFDNVPFYKGLRESQKWVSLVVIVYGIFLALGLERLFSKKIIEKNNVLYLIILGGIIMMQAPLLLFGFGGQIKPINYPKDWTEINDYIAGNQELTTKNQHLACKDTILFLPWHMYMSFNWIGHVVANPASAFFSCPVIQGTNLEWGGIYDNSTEAIGQKVEAWLHDKKDINSLRSKNFNIKYIILAKEVDWQDYAWLDKISGIKVEKETDNLKLYTIN